MLVPCFAQCGSEFKGQKDALRQARRAATGFGVSEGGVDKYTGETLEQIAARASAGAWADAGVTAGGSALGEESLGLRADAAREGGKCWSVDERRAERRRADSST